MIDERDLFERAAANFDPPVDAFDRFTDRRERHERNQRVVAGVVTFVIALALAAAALALRNPDVVQPAPPSDVFSTVHGWIAVGGLDSVTAVDPADSSQRTTLSASSGDPYAWSNDGRHLLVARTLGSLTNLYVLDGMGNETLVARDSASGGFSPDGSSVVYGGYHDHTVYEVPIEGGPPHVVVAGSSANGFAFPLQSPGGTEIAYTDVSNGESTGLWFMAPDGSNRRPAASLAELTSLMGGEQITDVYSMGWSPDSSSLAFGAANTSGLAAGIFTINADGSGLRRITGAATGLWWSAGWSPDGSQIAARSNRQGVLVMDADGSNEQVVEANPGGYFVAWNPLPPSPDSGT